MKLTKNTLLLCSVVAVVWAAAFCIYFTVPSEARTRPVAPPTVTDVATGLHNPRGLNFAPNGYLFVAEATANDTPTDLCGAMGDGQTRCAAETGAIARIDVAYGDVTRVLTGLPSLTAPDGNAAGATGVHDVSFQGMGNGYFTVGLGGDPTHREDYFEEFGHRYDRIGRFNPSGNYSLKQDLGDFEAENNPDGFVPDSNPYGIAALPGRVVVADAGGNDLLQIAANGSVSVLAVFPRVNRPAGLPGPTSVQAVPTSVALGPDGYLYVGQLTGGPFTVGIANVYRVPSGGGTPEVAYSGFTNIIDVAFGPDGSLYVVEIAQNAIPNFGGGGRIVRIAPDGTRSTVLSGPQYLFAPGGIAVSTDGSLYVTVASISPTDGKVIRIEQ
jgi:hypothetical protein